MTVVAPRPGRAAGRRGRGARPAAGVRAGRAGLAAGRGPGERSGRRVRLGGRRRPISTPRCCASGWWRSARAGSTPAPGCRDPRRAGSTRSSRSGTASRVGPPCSRCGWTTGRASCTSSAPRSPSCDISVRSAHVSTVGPQAVDVFYLQEQGAGRLSDERAAEAAHAVRDALVGTVAGAEQGVLTADAAVASRRTQRARTDARPAGWPSRASCAGECRSLRGSRRAPGRGAATCARSPWRRTRRSA